MSYIRKALNDLCGLTSGKVLDFGCGEGKLVRDLRDSGFDAFGCDQEPYWPSDLQGLLKPISTAPYRLPFEDDTFDAVVSTSVLEHAHNKEECFVEIRRVLKPGGHAIHLFPGKWYLPTEPHIHVPLSNFRTEWPKAWFAMWALVGIRNEFQGGMTWAQVADVNLHYAKTGLAYWSCSAYERLSMKVYGNFTWPMTHYIAHGKGGFPSLARKLPFRSLWGYLSKHLRIAVLMHRKT